MTSDLNDPAHARHQADLAALRDRWYREGHFRRETLTDALSSVATHKGDVVVTFCGPRGRRVATLGVLHEAAQRLGTALHRLGVRAGDVVAVQAPSRTEVAIAYQAAFLRGFILLPIVPFFGPAEVGFILRQTRARILIVPDRDHRRGFEAHVAALEDVPDLTHVIVIGEAWAGALCYADLVSGEIEPPRQPVAGPDDVCLILYTSGTTAEPKGAMHSHNSFLAELRAVPASIPRNGGPVLGVFPTGHIAGTIGLMASMVLGEPHILLDVFDGSEAARLIQEFRVTASAGTPYHLAMILDAAEAQGLDLSSLGAYMTGAASVPVPLLKRAEGLGIKCFRGYGMTEHPEATSSPIEASAEVRFKTDGRPRFGTELRIIDDEDADVPPDAEGEIVLRGPRQCLGYVDAARDEECYLPGGWFRTGDIGYLTATGELVVTDRKKDIINRGGEKLSAREIEEILSELPSVSEACVTSMPDPRLGERVRAFVILRPSASLDLAQIQNHFARAGVAKQKTPERLDLVQDLPRTPAGKPKKSDLRTWPLDT